MSLGINWVNYSLISWSRWKYSDQRSYLAFKDLKTPNTWWHILLFSCLLPLTLLLLIFGFMPFTWLYHLFFQYTRIYWGNCNGQWLLFALFPFCWNMYSKFLCGGRYLTLLSVYLVWVGLTQPRVRGWPKPGSGIPYQCPQWWTQAETTRAQSRTLLGPLAVRGSLPLEW